MPSLMSVQLTEAAVRDRSKTETRRLGWLKLKPGTPLTLCRKVQGRRRRDGTVEPLVRLAEVEVVAVRRERVGAITSDEVDREGFPNWSRDPSLFVDFFCRSMKCTPETEVTVITWRYLDGPAT